MYQSSKFFLNFLRNISSISGVIFKNAFTLLLTAAGLIAAVQAQSDFQIQKNTKDATLKSAARINPSTLAMEMTIPLGSYPGRNGNSLPIGLSYSSKVWSSEAIVTGYYQQSIPIIRANPQYAERTVSGWVSLMSPPQLDANNPWMHTSSGSTQPGGGGGGGGGGGFDIFGDCMIFNGAESAGCFFPRTASLFSPRNNLSAGGSFPFFAMFMPSSFIAGKSADNAQSSEKSETESEASVAYTPTATTAQIVPRIFLKNSDGSTVEFRKSDARITVNLPNSGDYKSGVYYSIDGSNMKLEYSAQGGATQNLYYPNGAKSVWAGSTYTYIDPQGNKSVFDAAELTWQTTLGEIVAPATANLNNVQTIRVPGLNNAVVNYSLVWASLGDAGVMTNPEPLRFDSAYECDPNNSVGGGSPALFSTGSCSYEDAVFNPKVLHKILLPNGTEYKFTYNVFGEIDKIVYPTGAYELFKYEQINPVSQATRAMYNEMNRGVTKRWVNSTGSQGDDGTPWNYFAGYRNSNPAALNQYNQSANPYEVVTVAPDGSKTERLLHAAPKPDPYRLDNILTGMTYEERVYATDGQQLMKRVLSDWTGDDPTGIGHPTRNARVSRETSVIFEPGSGAALAQTAAYQYDGYLNRIQTTVYDAVVLDASSAQSLAISQIPVGNPLKTSQQSYVTDANYINRGMVSMPLESVVRNGDGNGQIVARSQTAYDEAAYPIINEGAAAGWQDPQTTLRGNATTTRVWNSDANSWIATHAQFDKYGNLRKAWDASGDARRFVETEYSSQYAFAYPTKVISPAPDPDNTGHGTNQTTQATTAYNFYTGLPLTVMDDFGNTTTSEYNDILLRPTAIVAPNGARTEMIYNDVPGDLWVKVRKQIDQTNWDEATTFMDGLGRAVKTQSKDSQGDVFTETQYDQMGKIKQVASPYRIGELKYWTKNRYDGLGRSVESFAPALTADLSNARSLGTTAYTISTVPGFVGTVITATDVAGKTGRSITNALGQLMRADEATGNNDLGTIDNPTQPTFYSYNALGKMVKVNQGGQNRYFKYDTLGRLIRVRQPEQEANLSLQMADEFNTSGQWTVGFTYDNSGNVLTATDAKGVVITNAHDNLNRIIQRSYSGEPAGQSTPTVNYYYDGIYYDSNNTKLQATGNAKGMLSQVRSSISTAQTIAFDYLGRAKTYQQITDGQTFTSSYDEYNLSGALIQQTYPSGRTVRNALESDGDLAQVQSRTASTMPLKTYASDFSYTAAGGISQLKLGNGRWETAKFNTRQQVTELGLGTSAMDTSLWKVNYEFGQLNTDGINVDTTKNNGNIAKQTISFGGLAQPFVQTYKYDSLSRLTEAKETVGAGGQDNWLQQYNYDRYGNRQRNGSFQKIGSTVLAHDNKTFPTIEQTTNRFSANQGYTYDKNGNLTIDADNRQFVFNGDNKQTEVRDANGYVVGQYFYDGDGKRVKKYLPASGETTIFVYSSGKLIAEYSTAAPPANKTINYTTTDHLGTPRVITDATGIVTSRRDFMPFGEELYPDTIYRKTSDKYGVNDSVRQRFTGYEKDQETGLDFVEARYYNNAHGRFTAVDPLLASGKSLNPQTFNRYGYTSNNPITRIDKNGLDWYYTFEKIEGRFYATPKWCEGFGCSGQKWGTEVRSTVGRVTTVWNSSFAFRNDYSGGFSAIDFYENRSISTFSSLTEAQSQVQQWNRQAAVNFIAGALSGTSLVFEFSGAAEGMSAETDSQMFAMGQRAGTGASIAGAVTGVGLLNSIAKAFKGGSAIFRGIKLVCCFVEGTPVHTDKGLVPIEQVKVGDKVLSYDEKTKRFEYKTVAQTFTAVKDNIVKIKIRGEKLLTTTDEHPFYVKKTYRARDALSSGDDEEGEWLTAAELQVGQKVLRPDGRWTRITEITQSSEPTLVYNLEVEGNHNYFVGEIGVLSHNCSTAAEIASRVVSKFKNLECLDCAKELLGEFSKAGIKGTIRELSSAGAPMVRAGQNTGEAISDTGRHFGVQVGDMIYDLYHPQGINIKDWAKAYESFRGVQIVPLQ